MRKAFKYRLYPSQAQAVALEGQLTAARHLYNAALQERRDAWRMQRVSLNYYDQANQLRDIRAAGDIALANYSACQDVLRRVDKVFRAFFARVKRGQAAGYPRFKGRDRYDSFTLPAYGDGCKLLPEGKLRVQGVGHLKVKLHRPVAGDIKTVTLKREGCKWYACFSIECEARPLAPSTEAVGIDVGLSSFATLSNGEEVANLRHYRKAQRRLRVVQRRVARRKRGSRGRRKAVVLLHQAHIHVRNQRSDFQHQVSHALVGRYGLIAIEHLNVKGLAGGWLARDVHDAGWSEFIAKLTYKAEEAGRVLVKVNPNGTSQRCVCGQAVPKDLGDRWHTCPACGLSVSRDHAAALEILRLGLSLRDITCPVAESVSREAVCLG